MGLEVNSSSSMCRMCGRPYGRLKGYFPICYGTLYKGIGYLPYCNECVDSIYNTFYRELKDERAAVKRACRKLDIYWNDVLFDQAHAKAAARSLFRSYIVKANSYNNVGKTYDDTIEEEIKAQAKTGNVVITQSIPETIDTKPQDNEPIDEDIRLFWGPGYTNEMYRDLEQRRAYYLRRLPEGVEGDIGSEAMLRQICALDLDINRDRADGKPVDKSVATQINLLGELELKPKQKRETLDSATSNTTFGEWIKRWEDERPIPEPDPELRDIDGIAKFVNTWLYGHLAKMLNIKNAHSKLYDEEMERMRVENPEFDDEDDESLIYDIFASNEDE